MALRWLGEMGQVEGTARAKALRQAMLSVSDEQRRGQCMRTRARMGRWREG